MASMFSKHVHQHYEHDFSCMNRVLVAVNHSLILLNVPGNVNNNYMHVGHGMLFKEWIPQHCCVMI